MITEFIIILALFINALLVHEAAHLITGTLFDKYTYIVWRDNDLITYTSDLTKKQHYWFVASGILAGLLMMIPIALYAGGLIALILTLVYLYGCKFDFKQLWRIMKND